MSPPRRKEDLNPFDRRADLHPGPKTPISGAASGIRRLALSIHYIIRISQLAVDRFQLTKVVEDEFDL